jgi:hypothetical protein
MVKRVLTPKEHSKYFNEYEDYKNYVDKYQFGFPLSTEMKIQLDELMEIEREIEFYKYLDKLAKNEQEKEKQIDIFTKWLKARELKMMVMKIKRKKMMERLEKLGIGIDENMRKKRKIEWKKKREEEFVKMALKEVVDETFLPYTNTWEKSEFFLI